MRVTGLRDLDLVGSPTTAEMPRVGQLKGIGHWRSRRTGKTLCGRDGSFFWLMRPQDVTRPCGRCQQAYIRLQKLESLAHE